MYYVDEYAQRIVNSEKIIIYGARIVANEVANVLMGKPYNKDIEAFMVSSKERNPESLLGRPVITIDEGKDKYKDTLIIIAALEKYLDEIKRNLEERGFSDVISCGFESDLWCGIRGNYYRNLCIEKRGIYRTLEDEITNVSGDNNSIVHIYMAKCHADKELSDKRTYPWELQIQVGAALTDQTVSALKDDNGDNISDKNKEYCELTALYWIWKNDISDFAGLGHYRRHFDLNEEMIERLGNSDIDVILTIPILNFPSVRNIYENDHLIEDWDIMLQVLRELHPDYYDSALELQEGIYYYAYNMFIARKEIFDEYCAWLFPVLFECEKRCKPRDDKYQARYIGFLAERLLSIFFIHNWNRWKIVHARKLFLS